MEEAKILLEIIKCFLYDKEYVNTNNIDENKLYKLAKINSVSNFLQNWAKKYCKSEIIKNEIYKDYSTQIVKDTNENIELKKILNELEKNDIKTLIVKGAIMKDIYPQNYMREMCDIDILVQSEYFKAASNIMTKLGFSKYYNQEKHLIFTKLPFFIVEMHRKLILKKDIGYEYFNDIWPLCVKYKKYQNIYQLNLEDAYIFCILHLLIHFKYTGIKIKDMLDVYLYNEKYKNILDYNKLNEKFEELNIKEFEKNIKNIAYKWFGTDKISNFDDVDKFILRGTSSNNRVNYSIGESKGKIDVIKKFLFPELKIMQEKYTILKKVPILLPVMWGARIFKDAFSKENSLKSRVNTMKLIQGAEKSEVEKVKRIYNKLGIK